MSSKRIVTIEQGTVGRRTGYFTVRADGRIADMLDKGEMLHCIASLFYEGGMPYSHPETDEIRCTACRETYVRSPWMRSCPHCGIVALLPPPRETSAA